MDADVLPFLDDEEEGATAEVEQPEIEKAEEEPEAKEEPEQPEPKGEEPAAPPAASDEKQTGQIPLTALHEEREKRQAAQRELDELRRWREQQEAQRQKPDFFENPEAVLTAQQQQFQRAMVAEKLKQSRFMAEREFGAETVSAAFDLFNDPKHAPKSHELLNEPSPFHAAVEYYKQQKTLEEIGSDPEAWRKSQEETLRAQLRAEIEAELAQSKPAAPPRSLASAPSAGGETNPTGSAFDSLFGD